MRKYIFSLLFNKKEQTAIINALYRRSDDKTTENVQGEKEIKMLCANIAKELMS